MTPTERAVGRRELIVDLVIVGCALVACHAVRNRGIDAIVFFGAFMLLAIAMTANHVIHRGFKKRAREDETSWVPGSRLQRARESPNEGCCRLMPARSGLHTIFARTAIGIVLAILVGTAQAVAASGETVVLILHAEGASIYQCTPTPDGDRNWEAREEIATLLQDGKTVGRQYAGPHW
jgi:hypothetical protein